MYWFYFLDNCLILTDIIVSIFQNGNNCFPFSLSRGALGEIAEGWTDRVFGQACACMSLVVTEWFR